MERAPRSPPHSHSHSPQKDELEQYLEDPEEPDIDIDACRESVFGTYSPVGDVFEVWVFVRVFEQRQDV